MKIEPTDNQPPKRERPRTIIERARCERKRLIRSSTVANAGFADVCPVHNRLHVRVVEFVEVPDRLVYQCTLCGTVLGDAPRGGKVQAAILPNLGGR